MEYEKQATDFLTRHNLTLKIAFKGDKCPSWDTPEHIHGDQYRVTIKRDDTNRSLSFNFWNSFADKQDGKRPTA